LRITEHNTRSAYLEMLLEHLFVGSVQRALWRRAEGRLFAEILKPQVDDAGYDVVMECNGHVRHIQLKSSRIEAKTAFVNAQLRLQEKPSACVIWMFFEPESLELSHYLWFGRGPGERLPALTSFPIAKHTKADSKGVKAERPDLRKISKGKFEKLNTLEQVVEHLFGIRCAAP
jgi:hypothetical protein